MLDLVFRMSFIFPNGQVQRTWEGQNPEYTWGVKAMECDLESWQRALGS